METQPASVAQARPLSPEIAGSAVTGRRIGQVAAIAAFVCIFVGVISLRLRPPPVGFELSIYSAETAPFFDLLLASFAIVGIGSFFAIRARARATVAVLLFAAFLSGLAVVSAPFARGYAFYPNGDGLSHLGFIRDIIFLGRIGPSNLYPIPHILTAATALVTGLSPIRASYLTVHVWYALFTAGGAFLARRLLPTWEGAALASLMFLPVMLAELHAYLHPSAFSLYLVPWVLGSVHAVLQQGRHAVAWASISVIVATALTFAHPMTPIFVVLLLAWTAAHAMLSRRGGSAYKSTIAQTTCIVILAIYASWYLRFGFVIGNLRRIHAFLTADAESNVLGEQLEIATRTNATPVQLLSLFVNQYGGLLIFIALAAASGAYLLVLALRQRARLFSPYVLIGGYAVIGAAMFIGSLVGFTGEREVMRIARFLVFPIPLLAGVLGARASLSRPWLVALVCCAFVGAAYFNTLATFGGPDTARGNLQVTAQDIEGVGWLIDHEDGTLPVATIGVKLQRFKDAIFGWDADGRQYRARQVPLPSQFGLDPNATLGAALGSGWHYTIAQEALTANYYLLSENLRVDIPRFIEEDFVALDSDPTHAWIYSNGGTKIGIAR